MSPYAAGTEVSSERSRAEIEQLLRRFGADSFMSGWDRQTNREQVGFRVHNRMVRLTLPMPDSADPLISCTPTGKRRNTQQIEDEYAKEVRRRWRSLLLVLKAKLTAVEDGISTIEREFLADVLLPDGRTLGEWASPQLDQAYGSAEMPALLPGAP